MNRANPYAHTCKIISRVASLYNKGVSNYRFSHIAIIYNPNSTGDSVRNAKKLHKDLVAKLPKSVRTELIPTERAGHGEELARDFSTKHKRSLIVSVSGDGGYNEVVNGVIASGSKTSVVAVLPSGNANDHAKAISEASLLGRILDPHVIKIDSILVEATVGGVDWKRYAHSYVGFGLTAYIGKKLTENKLNSFNEKWLVLKYMVLFRSISLKIQPDLRWHKYSSVIFSNIAQMSKVIKLAPEARLRDDRVEVYILRAQSFIRMIFSLLFASTVGLKPTAQVKKLTLRAKRDIAVQLDGEVEVLDAKKKIAVSVARDAIRTLK